MLPLATQISNLAINVYSLCIKQALHVWSRPPACLLLTIQRLYQFVFCMWDECNFETSSQRVVLRFFKGTALQLCNDVRRRSLLRPSSAGTFSRSSMPPCYSMWGVPTLDGRWACLQNYPRSPRHTPEKALPFFCCSQCLLKYWLSCFGFSNLLASYMESLGLANQW